VKLQSNYVPDSFTAEIDNYWEFLKVLPWRENWMLCLMMFHLTCLLLIIISRKSANLQYCIFFLLLCCVYFSERLNELAADNHKRFASENFFDSSGLFISTVFSIPVFFNCIVLIVMWLSSAARTLIDVKQRQIRQQQQRQQNSDDKETKKDN